MREVVQSKLDAYQYGRNSDERLSVIWETSDEVKTRCGLFLDRNSDGLWVEVSETAVLKKVGVCFRNMVSGQKERNANENDRKRAKLLSSCFSFGKR